MIWNDELSGNLRWTLGMVPDQWFFWMSLFFWWWWWFPVFLSNRIPHQTKEFSFEVCQPNGLTPLNTNMEHKNHPLEKETLLNQTTILRVSITPPKKTSHIPWKIDGWFRWFRVSFQDGPPFFGNKIVEPFRGGIKSKCPKPWSWSLTLRLHLSAICSLVGRGEFSFVFLERVSGNA